MTEQWTRLHQGYTQADMRRKRLRLLGLVLIEIPFVTVLYSLARTLTPADLIFLSVEGLAAGMVMVGLWLVMR